MVVRLTGTVRFLSVVPVAVLLLCSSLAGAAAQSNFTACVDACNVVNSQLSNTGGGTVLQEGDVLSRLTDRDHFILSSSFLPIPFPPVLSLVLFNMFGRSLCQSFPSFCLYLPLFFLRDA